MRLTFEKAILLLKSPKRISGGNNYSLFKRLFKYFC